MNKHVEEFKKYRAPWWAVLLGKWNRRREMRANRKMPNHIAVVTFWTRRRDTMVVTTTYLHLYQKGRRRYFEYLAVPGSLPLGHHHFYNKYVVPWMHFKIDNNNILQLARQTEKEPTQWT